ncbi:hypothetical protein [Oleiharenicola lentus]|uniref:hypothetical protein n=1 Tax=Oleiharenicola lentus TaxID=2508720 RepID=UPI003F671F29
MSCYETSIIVGDRRNPDQIRLKLSQEWRQSIHNGNRAYATIADGLGYQKDSVRRRIPILLVCCDQRASAKEAITQMQTRALVPASAIDLLRLIETHPEIIWKSLTAGGPAPIYFINETNPFCSHAISCDGMGFAQLFEANLGERGPIGDACFAARKEQ